MHENILYLSHYRSLQGIPVILLLNKQDLLAEKIQNGIRLEFYFPEFEDYVFSDINTCKILYRHMT
jgi:hypothetical protein